MKRGRKISTTSATRTIAGNDLRKRIRLIGPVIGAEFNINPDAKTSGKKSKPGRTAWQVFDCDGLATWQQAGMPLPETAVLLQNSPKETGFDVNEFCEQRQTSIWSNEPDELAIQLLQILTKGSESDLRPSSTLSWGSMRHSVASDHDEGVVQSAGKALESWGFGRVVVSRIQSSITKLLKAFGLGQSNTVRKLTSGCDGVNCEFVLELAGCCPDILPRDLADVLSNMPFAVVSVERGNADLTIRMISRCTALAFEGNPATIVFFQYLRAHLATESLPKAG